MKLLFDESLSRKLVTRLGELYSSSAHVVEFDLLESPHGETWEFAKTRDFVIREHPTGTFTSSPQP